MRKRRVQGYTDNRALLIVYIITFGTTRRCGGLKTKSASDFEREVKLRTARLGSQTVQRVIALTHSPNLTAESEGGGGGKRPAVGVDVRDGDLDRSVVLGGDETV